MRAHEDGPDESILLICQAYYVLWVTVGGTHEESVEIGREGLALTVRAVVALVPLVRVVASQASALRMRRLRSAAMEEGASVSRARCTRAALGSGAAAESCCESIRVSWVDHSVHRQDSTRCGKDMHRYCAYLQ